MGRLVARLFARFGDLGEESLGRFAEGRSDSSDEMCMITPPTARETSRRERQSRTARQEAESHSLGRVQYAARVVAWRQKTT